MNRPPDNAEDELLAALLVAYDEARGQDIPPEIDDRTIGGIQLSARFEAAKKCLDLLDRVSRFGSENSPLFARAGMDTDARGTGGSSLRRCPMTIGRFSIERELGRGGLGVVYLAKDPSLGRYVAVKIPRSEIVAEESQHRFLREAEAAARLGHPHLVALYEVGHDGSACYLVSEYCSGPTLAEWLRDHAGPLPAREAAILVRQLADAVHHAHGRGVLHRDIKPSNVLLEPVSETEHERPSVETSRLFPKLTDFGMAKLMESTGDQTRSGAILGTPAYMAPEQVDGRLRDIDPRTDIYGLGAVLYELMTGVAPFRGISDVDTLRQLLLAEPAPPRQLCPSVPRDLEAIALKCLAKKSDARYPTAQHLAEDLGRFLLGLPTEARPPGAVDRFWKWARRRPTAAALTSLAAVSAVVLVAVVAIYDSRLRSEVIRADAARALAEHEVQASRRLLYTADVRRAFESLNANNVVQTLEILDRQVPAAGQEDLREFTWFYLRDACDQAAFQLARHEGDVFAVAWSADGHHLASAGKDATVRIWDAADGRLRRVLRGHAGEVVGVAFSPASDLLASASEDRTVRLWNPLTGQSGAALRGHTDHVMALAFAPHGRWLASGGRDGSVRIWEPTTAQQVATLEGEMDVIRAVAFSPAGDRLYAVDEAGRLHVWRTTDWSPLPGVTRPLERFFGLAVSRDGRQVAAAGRREDIGIWQADNGNLSSACELTDGHREWIQSLAFSPVDDVLASAGKDGVIRLWRTDEPTPQRTFLGHKGRVWSVAWSPDGRRIASGDAEGAVRVWNLAETSRVYEPLANKLAGGEFLPDGSLVTAGEDGKVRIWSADAHAPMHVLSAHDNSVRGVSTSADGVWIATQAEDGTTRVWRRDMLEERFAIHATGHITGALAWSPASAQFVTLLDDKTLALVEVPSQQVVRRFPHESSVRNVAFTSDGRHLVTTSQALQILDVRSGQVVYSHPDAHRALAVASDGGVIAAATGSNVSLIRTANGFQLSTLTTSGSDATCLAIHGNTLAVGILHPSMVSLWDLRTNQLLVNLRCEARELRTIDFSPNGKRLVAVGVDADGRGRIWQWAIQDSNL